MLHSGVHDCRRLRQRQKAVSLRLPWVALALAASGAGCALVSLVALRALGVIALEGNEATTVAVLCAVAALLTSALWFPMASRLRGILVELVTELKTDALTGALSRKELDEVLQRELRRAHRYSTAASLMIFDVDHFKAINDTYGHPLGDDVLRGVVRLVRSVVRESDRVARYGGDEFIVLMPQTSLQGARRVAERILGAVSGSRFADGELQVSLSIGVAQAKSEDSQALLAAADGALLEAKRQGRGCVVSVAA